MNHTCLCLPSRSWYSFTNPERWKAELALNGWLVTYRNKCPVPGIEPGHGRHLSTNWARCRLTSLIEANTLTTMPDHRLSVCPMSLEQKRCILGLRLPQNTNRKPMPEVKPIGQHGPTTSESGQNSLGLEKINIINISIAKTDRIELWLLLYKKAAYHLP